MSYAKKAKQGLAAVAVERIQHPGFGLLLFGIAKTVKAEAFALFSGRTPKADVACTV